MVSINFYPSIGGIEILTANLAKEFVKMGHQVSIITNTPDDNSKTFPFRILRNPSKTEVFNAYKNCDIFIHQSISLKYVWPLFLRYKPFFIVYHQVGWENGIKGLIKRFFSFFSHNICVSKTTAKAYKLKSYHIIYNAFDNKIFNCTNNQNRKDIVFVGRLNKDKGAYLLIDAFNQYKKLTNSNYQLNMIGDSIEKKCIVEYALKTEYAHEIHFLGSKSPKEIATILNSSHILAVTSTHPYYEAFGIVVLEGLACGCIVVGADGDGIEEALHNNGILYKNGDTKALCNALIKAHNTTNNLSFKAKEWLNSRTIFNVATQYIQLFQSKIRSYDANK